MEKKKRVFTVNELAEMGNWNKVKTKLEPFVLAKKSVQKNRREIIETIGEDTYNIWERKIKDLLANARAEKTGKKISKQYKKKSKQIAMKHQKQKKQISRKMHQSQKNEIDTSMEIVDEDIGGNEETLQTFDEEKDISIIKCESDSMVDSQEETQIHDQLSQLKQSYLKEEIFEDEENEEEKSSPVDNQQIVDIREKLQAFEQKFDQLHAMNEKTADFMKKHQKQQRITYDHSEEISYQFEKLKKLQSLQISFKREFEIQVDQMRNEIKKVQKDCRDTKTSQAQHDRIQQAHNDSIIKLNQQFKSSHKKIDELQSQQDKLLDQYEKVLEAQQRHMSKMEVMFQDQAIATKNSTKDIINEFKKLLAPQPPLKQYSQSGPQGEVLTNNSYSKGKDGKPKPISFETPVKEAVEKGLQKTVQEQQAKLELQDKN